MTLLGQEATASLPLHSSSDLVLPSVANTTVIVGLGLDDTAGYHHLVSTISHNSNSNPTWIILGQCLTGNINLPITNINIVIIYVLNQITEILLSYSQNLSNCQVESQLALYLLGDKTGLWRPVCVRDDKMRVY